MAKEFDNVVDEMLVEDSLRNLQVICSREADFNIDKIGFLQKMISSTMKMVEVVVGVL